MVEYSALLYLKQWYSILEENSQKEFDNDRFLRLLMDGQRQIYAFILASVHNISDADDIMQDVSTVMWHRFKDYDSSSNFTAWGIGITRKLILSFYSKKKRGRFHFDNKMLESLKEIACSKINEADRRVEFLQGCVKQLTKKDREFIELRYNHNLKTNAIADKVGLSTHVAYRAMAKIHGLLQLCIQRKMREADLI